MAYGFIQVLAPSTHAELALSGTGGGTQYPSIKILNPNDGVVYVTKNRDCIGTGQGAWDWKVPSQSYAALPGEFTSVGMFYVDQSGAGRQGEITLYPSNNKIDDPMFIAIGRAIQAQALNLDITETNPPLTPATGVLRVWAFTDDNLYLKTSSNNVKQVIDSLAAYGSGALSGNILTPALNPTYLQYSLASGIRLTAGAVANILQSSTQNASTTWLSAASMAFYNDMGSTPLNCSARILWPSSNVGLAAEISVPVGAFGIISLSHLKNLTINDTCQWQAYCAGGTPQVYPTDGQFGTTATQLNMLKVGG